MDVDAIAPLVPVDDQLGKALRHIQVTPVLVLDAFSQSFRDGRCHAEIHISDAHADGDMLPAIKSDLLIVLDAVGADAIVGSIEIILARVLGRGGAHGYARSGSAGDCHHWYALEKRPAIESDMSSHG